MAPNLSDYLSQRYYGREEILGNSGSFLTLSRETGCSGTDLAIELVSTFRKMGSQWRFLNREILDQAAEVLHLGRSKLEHGFLLAKGSIMDDIVKSLSSRYYKNDQKIRDTVAHIIQTEARKGKTIIVSSAGAFTTAGIPGGIHIRLVAPMDWRIKELSKRLMLSEKEVAAFILKNDKKRTFIYEQFAGERKAEPNYDLVINRAAFSSKQAVAIILDTISVKGLL